jgi:hypothetical protein
MPDTLDDAYTRLSAALPGIDSGRPSQGSPSLRRYKAPEERREVRQAVYVRRRPVPEPADELGPCKGCRHMARCTAEVICCQAFVLHARLGSECSADRWRLAPRFPSAAILEGLRESARRAIKTERRREREAAAAELQRRDAEFEASGASGARALRRGISRHTFASVGMRARR